MPGPYLTNGRCRPNLLPGKLRFPAFNLATRRASAPPARPCWTRRWAASGGRDVGCGRKIGQRQPMHELSIACRLVETAVAAAADNEITSVATAHLKLGELAGVDKEALLLAYEIAAANSVLAGS